MRPSLRLPSTILKASRIPTKQSPLLFNSFKMSTGVPNAAAGFSNNPQQSASSGTGIPSETAQKQASTTTGAGGSSITGNDADLGIESNDYKLSSGVDLSEKQKDFVGSVLDLFAGKPTLRKLALWTDDATFSDPLTKAEGRKQYSAQWYGLAAAFSDIQRLSCEVTSSGNPIEMNVSTKYKVKGLGTEKTIDSVIKVFTEGEKIVKVEDKWNGNIPDGAFAKMWRNLNSITVPAFVSVPKNEQEEAAKK